MNTKNYILSFAFLMLAFLGANAQGLYFKLGASYGIPMGSQSLLEPVTLSSDIVGNSTVVTSSSESVKGSYGSGIYYDFSAGYKFTPFIGIDLNISYQTGKEYEGSSVATGGNADLKFNSKTRADGIFVSPTAMFMTGAGVVRPYLMVGCVLGSTKIEDTSELYVGGRDEPIVGVIVYETKGDFAFGFRGGAGIDFNVASKFSIYVQMTFSAISYYAQEKEITQYEADGVDQLPNLNVRQRSTIYVDKIIETTVDGTVVVDDNKPTEELRKPLPLSNLSFGLGVKYRLSVD